MTLGRGTILLVGLAPTVGHEQAGTRPCVVVSDPAVASSQKYGVLAVVPITTKPGEGALYPSLEPGSSGLLRTSYALIDQIRAVDKSRVLQRYGAVGAEEIAAIDKGLALFLGLLGAH